MKTKEVESIGLKYALEVPETAAEYDTMAAVEGACVESAVENAIYRSTNNEFRALVSEAVEDQYKFARKVKPGAKRKDGTVPEVYDETENKFIERFIASQVAEKVATGTTAEAAEKEVRADLQAIADLVVKGDGTEKNPGIKFDPKKKERTFNGPRAVSKLYLTAAQTLIDGGQATVVAEKLSAKLGRTVEVTPESLGAAIRDHESKDAAKVVANVMADLG